LPSRCRAEGNAAVRDHRGHHQRPHGLRHHLDHDAWRTGSATTTLAWLGYLQSFQFLRLGEGAATLYVLTILSLALAIVYFLFLRRKGPARIGAPTARPKAPPRRRPPPGRQAEDPEWAPRRRLNPVAARQYWTYRVRRRRRGDFPLVVSACGGARADQLVAGERPRAHPPSLLPRCSR